MQICSENMYFNRLSYEGSVMEIMCGQPKPRELATERETRNVIQSIFVDLEIRNRQMTRNSLTNCIAHM